eukprot:CAMPEP_0204822624 /NCGR_PEP_ID=MMETSP1346-20131115/820_1 /ASSEMBLY_ACC=CAM_ASM_000771 /TAXON_ID=215587 /ORGANISM="Aplanochytrium stocchinoi, Strain GSBS06" /LENGTH=378 /DNA_ID=CAMNT_0051948943 /DNA_START=141 /DNA_END=1278 /DNA_ORIENTATION=-
MALKKNIPDPNPAEGFGDYETAKEVYKTHVLELSKRYEIWKSCWTKLLCPPPASFSFNLQLAIPFAKIALAHDKELEKARYHFVPAKISEFDFWRSYFWNVQQIRANCFHSLDWDEDSQIDLTMLSLKDIMLSKESDYLKKHENPSDQENFEGVLARANFSSLEEEKHEMSDLDQNNMNSLPVLYAAPWEVAKSNCWKIAVLQARLLHQRALALSRLRKIWSAEDGRLIDAPPPSFYFSCKEVASHSQVALDLDENLQLAFDDLVPESINEYQFWSSYFWNIEKLKLEVMDELQANGKGAESFPLFSGRLVPETDEYSTKIHKIYYKCRPLARLVVLRYHTRAKLKRLQEVSATSTEPDFNQPVSSELPSTRKVKFSV